MEFSDKDFEMYYKTSWPPGAYFFSTMEDKPRVATKSLYEVCFPGTLTVVSRVFILRLTSVCVHVCVCVWGGFLTIAYCFPFCLLKNFVGRQDCDGKGQSRDTGIPQFYSLRLGIKMSFTLYVRQRSRIRLCSSTDIRHASIKKWDYTSRL